jgi:hypothetical protein
VEVSEVGTGVWQQITPVNGYPYVLDDICGNPLAFHNAYAHDSPGGSAFVSENFDLTPFSRQAHLHPLPFRLGLRQLRDHEGWYIDDVGCSRTPRRGRGRSRPGARSIRERCRRSP